MPAAEHQNEVTGGVTLSPRINTYYQ